MVGVRALDDATEFDECVLDVEAVDWFVAVDLSLQPTSVVKLVFEHGLRLVEIVLRGYADVAKACAPAERATDPGVEVPGIPRPHEAQLKRTPTRNRDVAPPGRASVGPCRAGAATPGRCAGPAADRVNR